MDFKETAIPLRGEWAFFFGRSITPDQINASTVSQAAFTEVPSTWNNIPRSDGTTGPYGFATYAACVILPPNAPGELTLYLKNAATSYRMFINGQPVAESGIFSENPATAVPHSGPVHVTFPVTSPRLQIIIQVSNHVYIKGGLWETPTLGTPGILLGSFNRLKTFEHYIFAILIFLFAYHLVLFLMRRKSPEYLAYSITCLIAALGNSVRSTYVVYDFIPDINWILLKKSQFYPVLSAGYGFCYTFLFTF